jgi:hypothetical protein
MKFKRLLKFLDNNGLTDNIADVMGNESTKVNLLNQITRSADPDVLADFQQLLRGGNFEQDLISAVEGFRGNAADLIDPPTRDVIQRDLDFDNAPETRVEGTDTGPSFEEVRAYAKQNDTPYGRLSDEDAKVLYDAGYGEGPDAPAMGEQQIAAMLATVKGETGPRPSTPQVDSVGVGSKADELHTVQKNEKDFEDSLTKASGGVQTKTPYVPVQGSAGSNNIAGVGSQTLTADDAATFAGNPDINEGVKNPLTENEAKMTGGAVPVVADTMNAPGTSESMVGAGDIDPITQAILEQESPAYQGNTLPNSDLIDRPGGNPWTSSSRGFEAEIDGQKYRGPESGQNTRPNANPTNPQNSIGDLVQQRDGTVPNAETDVPPQNFSDVGAGSGKPNALFNNFGGYGEYVGLPTSPYPIRQGLQNSLEGLGLSPENASKVRKPTDYVTAVPDMLLRNPGKTAIGTLIGMSVPFGAQDEIDQLGPGAAIGPDGQLIPEMPANETPASEQELMDSRSRAERAMDKWIDFSTGASKFDQMKLNHSGPVSNEDNIRQLRKGI